MFFKKNGTVLVKIFYMLRVICPSVSEYTL